MCVCAGSLANDALRKGEAGTGGKKGREIWREKKIVKPCFIFYTSTSRFSFKRQLDLQPICLRQMECCCNIFFWQYVRCAERSNFLKKSALSQIVKKRFPPTCLTCIFGQGFFKISAGKRSGSILTGNLGKKIIIGVSKLLLLAFTQHNKK